MRVMIVAALVLAGCGPSRIQVQVDEITARALARTDRAAEQTPLYMEMCRAQMPTVSDAAVERCARDRVIAEMREIQRQGMAELEWLRGGTRRPDPNPPGSGFNPVYVTPALR